MNGLSASTHVRRIVAARKRWRFYRLSIAPVLSRDVRERFW
jgi:hypothetical protein